MEFTKESKHLEKLFDIGYELLKEENQLKILLRSNCLAAPTSFIKRIALLKLNGFDERFPMFEDYPCWINVVKNNYIIETIDVTTVIYRVNDAGVSQNSNLINKEEFYNSIPFRRSSFDFEFKILIKENFKKIKFLKCFKLLINVVQFKISVNLFNNNKTMTSVLVYNFFAILKPSFYYNFFKK